MPRTAPGSVPRLSAVFDSSHTRHKQLGRDARSCPFVIVDVHLPRHRLESLHAASRAWIFPFRRRPLLAFASLPTAGWSWTPDCQRRRDPSFVRADNRSWSPPPRPGAVLLELNGQTMPAPRVGRARPVQWC